MDFIGAGASILGGIFGNNASNQQAAAAQQAAQNQAQVNKQLIGNINDQTAQYNTSYAPVLPTLSQGLQSQGTNAAADTSQLSQMLLQAGLDPSIIQQITGVNSQQQGQNAVNYLANPNATNLATAGQNEISNLNNTSGTNLAGVTPGVSNFYNQEMQTGLNPAVAQNAQNQIQQALTQQIANARNDAAPGQNMNALTQNLQNQALSQHANLANTLAGQSQNFMNTGAAGSLGAAQGLDTQKQNMLQGATNTAGTVDAQKMNMLQNAASGAQNINQTALGNLSGSNSAANTILQNLQNFLGQGQGTIANANNALGGVGQSYGATAAADSANAQKSAAGAGASFGNAITSLGNAGLFGGGGGGDSGVGLSSANNYGTGDAGTTGYYTSDSIPNMAASNGAADMNNASFGDYTTSPLSTSAAAANGVSPLSGSANNAQFNPALFTGGVQAGQPYNTNMA